MGIVCLVVSQKHRCKETTVLGLLSSLLSPLYPVTCDSLVQSRTIQRRSDVKWVRAVRYDEDVMKLFGLNFLIGSQEVENACGVLTPRAFVNKIKNEKAELVKDSSALYSIARIFERAFYGRKQIFRTEYELFLTSLSKALTNPKVIICGPK